MRCALCGLEFEERDAVVSCEGCPMKSGDCNMLRCPNCGYENPGEPQILKMVRKWRK
jgi:DNA-directed RNA polymerase subunit RPC12/RpoP